MSKKSVRRVNCRYKLMLISIMCFVCLWYSPLWGGFTRKMFSAKCIGDVVKRNSTVFGSMNNVTDRVFKAYALNYVGRVAHQFMVFGITCQIADTFPIRKFWCLPWAVMVIWWRNKILADSQRNKMDIFVHVDDDN